MYNLDILDYKGFASYFYNYNTPLQIGAYKSFVLSLLQKMANL